MKEEYTYKAVGVMSGTSLDGLDLVLCEFTCQQGAWHYAFLKGTTVLYPDKMKNELAMAHQLNAYSFVELHRNYGRFIGDEVAKFRGEHCDIDLVASHGHTVFHEPDNNVTFQIGCGAQIAAACGMPVVSDFRTLDIALGGQGAPLVPIGDSMLFGKYDACVNLGGFANISFGRNGERIAFDICAVNIVINEIVQKEFGVLYDESGQLGAGGKVDSSLLKELNSLDFYGWPAPKSLAREWVETTFMPILKSYDSLDKKDILATCYHHFAWQIAAVLNQQQVKSCLFTGGGTYNHYLMQLIGGYSKAGLIIPDKQVIDFKEAIIFAFLGVLRMSKQVNCLASVTGASKNNIGGSVFIH
ncbi:anhydro-N-acetylmuramic acid kinase [Saccharicrinis carchari]|uniref:Anhydro-N-acetylmuramic acid kinase n=1 Tax=Saccharicrinis carchari TaxID=1168039 RepID=A0A521C1D6_SACCC|nr:anhydro-N-acetylmuramic acid kinase [Saccharicrinis carchari]SMO53272.1 anhydro-N-acetylmuramic acid kinase [Saccharicrinis carchari]